LLRGKKLQSIFLWLERRLMRRFDRVSTISRRMLRQLACKGVDLVQSDLVPNWVNLAQTFPMPPAAAAQALREGLSINDRQKVLLFSGTMNRKQGLGVLVEAAQALVARDDIVFVLCGAGEMKAGLEHAAARLPNLRFLDLQPAERLNHLLNLADVHLLPQLRGAADLVLPSKLGGMLASGRAVIAAAEPGSEIALTVRRCGLCVTPEDASEFVNAITQLCDDDALRLEMGRAARLIAEQTLGFDVAMQKLDRGFASLVHEASSAPAWTEPAVRS
jgi:colanic acid biosynthesis glycosyl transferase WcaI